MNDMKIEETVEYFETCSFDKEGDMISDIFVFDNKKRLGKLETR